MEIIMYRYGKERNSTSIPDATKTVHNNYDCIIKDPFSLVAPTLIFNFGESVTPFWNYCYIPDFGRYYFIDGWTCSGKRWFANTSVDVLASRRNEILETYQYVLRSASQSNAYVADGFYPATSLYIHSDYPFPDDYWTENPVNCTFVLDISGSGNATYLYVFSYTQFIAFQEFLLGSTDWLNIDTSEISDSLAKMLFDPLQYVASCRVYPIDFNTFINATGAVAVTKIPFGWWSVDKPGYRIPKAAYSKTASITYPEHPQATRGHWLNFAPYTTIHAFFPPFGSFDLEPSLFWSFGDAPYIKCNVYIDLISGNSVLRFYNRKNKVVFETSAQVGVDMPLFAQSLNNNFTATNAVISGASAILGNIDNATAQGGTKADISRVAASLFNTASQETPVSVSSGFDLGGAVKDFVSGFLTSASTVQRFGSASSLAAFKEPPHILVTQTQLAEEDKERNGRPLALVVQLKTLSGYTTCQHPHVALDSLTATENDAINNYLANGFYND